ncbi:MAG: hypothetical protein JSW16_03035 [Dehalococcoidales bacterium]|nr:MAG: hypothetical protein JSW16_03035 [Dehalococcoidales bacterium]
MRTRQTAVSSNMGFYWGYILLPLLIFFFSVIAVVYFYRLLPVEVAYRFLSDGSPDRWLPRSTVILWVVLPQLIMVILAVLITWGITRLAVRFRAPDSNGTAPQGMLKIMGNMVALPQTILLFAMLDIFSYNAYQVHLLPLWVNAVVVMGLGGIILGISFIRAIRQTWIASQ